MSILLKDIINLMRFKAPEYLALKEDNTGLIIGDLNASIDNILISLDINESIIDEAICKKVNLIITHHPIIFNSIKKINTEDFKGRNIIKLISNNINVYSAHTNLDVVFGGTNDYLAQLIGLKDSTILSLTYEDKENDKQYGIGRMGRLPNSISLKELCQILKNSLNCSYLKVIGDLNTAINKVGICTGSGASYISDAFKASCDVYITGDVKYHDACDAKDMGICIIDAGHFNTENIYMEQIYKYLMNELSDSSVNLYLSKLNSDPFIIV